ncbi:MAG: membrane protein insertion efficiency factor YidD [candidate division Zixibacteria bacterium]|nr:membrane protein insertion efficiency factor YidD [candidate division Zixibacteria bacterium]
MNDIYWRCSIDTSALSFHDLFTNSAIRIYQKYVSPYKGGSCLMHPHCSAYGRLAFRNHNPIKAFIMTSDRLHRCGHDLDNYEVVEVNDFLRFYDPLKFDFKNCFSDSLDHPETQDNQVATYGKDDRIQTAPVDSALYNFAFSLQSYGYFDDAITEYRRLISYYPNSPLSEDAHLNVFDCHNLQGDYVWAIQWGRYTLENELCTSYKNQIEFSMGLGYLKMGNNNMARRSFGNILSDERGLSDKAQMLTGLSFAYQLDWDNAIVQFSGIDSRSIYFKNVEDCIFLCQQGKNLPYKSPTFAGMLAAIPGLGYLYDGYPKTALSSFIVNGLFFWGTYQAFDNRDYGLGALMGIFSFGWYSGNIYGSVISASRRNVKLERDILSRFAIGFVF